MKELIDQPVRKHFASDNNSGVIPEVMEALGDVNRGHVASYGADGYTELANQEIQRLFGECEPYYVFNGTAANVLAIEALCESYEAVLCSDVSHLQNDECGAPEKNTGSKLLLCESKNGKLSVESIQKRISRLGDTHHVQAKMISITQPTEYASCYSYDELKEISDFAKKNDLYLHIDGSRLVHASTYLQKTLKELTCDIGADIVSFGGTKNGLLGGEVILVFRPELKNKMRYIRKQSMQLAGKMRFLSAQFYAWLKNDTWKKYSDHSLEMARYLYSELSQVEGVNITQPVESNAVFAILPKAVCKKVREKFFFYIWNQDTWEVRFMVSFDTTKEDIDSFVKEIRVSL